MKELFCLGLFMVLGVSILSWWVNRKFNQFVKDMEELENNLP